VNLPLATFAIAANPDGTVTIGTATLPAWAARDLATRIAAAAGDIPEEVAARVKVRVELDRTFARATPITVRDMQSGATGKFPAVRDEHRVIVRLSDSITAILLPEGERYRGFAVHHRFDPLFGIVTETCRPFARFSCNAAAVEHTCLRMG
jgi:hypothetical protein